ncbi:Fanconi anemia group F protein [Gastrophryne carolinensis]
MAGKLKTMLENLDHFLELLALSRTVFVKDWDLVNVQRALEWASYFQHVHSRFKANSSIRNGFEDHLATKNQELRVHFKLYQDVCFCDLMKAQTVLCMALLQNNALPSGLFKYLLEMLQESDPKRTAPLCLDHVISQNAASELFQSLPLLTCDRSQNPLDNPVLVTQSDILRSKLHRQLRGAEDGQRLSLVSDVLSRVSPPLVYHLIAVGLQSGDFLDSELQNQLDEVLLDWVTSSEAAWIGFCGNVTPHVLSGIASRHFKFRSSYLDYLEKLGGGMEQDIHSGSWASTNPRLAFHEFLEHFTCLFKGSDDLKQCVTTRLQALKSQDGGYDIAGVSIWTDVLIQINQS